MSTRALTFGFVTLSFVMLALAAPPAHACLWDRDTLWAERMAFPSALELMTGKFLHHSDDYYRWRLKDRAARLSNRPGDLALRDDLAVAYDKLGRHDEAIAVMKEALEVEPKRYESHANLGTFYIHGGELEQGIAHIDEALKINPDAHFGRERYQRLLAQYVIERRKAGATLPLKGDDVTFASWLARQDDPEARDLGDDATAKALEGVLGMMRFGDHTSPVLLEALGDLIARPYNTDGSGPLAARAYLLAGERAGDEEAQKAYEALATQAITLKQGLELGGVKENLVVERADAKAWLDQVHANEKKWIEAGGDVDAEFEKMYVKDGEPVEPEVLLSDKSVCCGGCSAAERPAQVPWRAPVVGLALLALVGLGTARRARRPSATP